MGFGCGAGPGTGIAEVNEANAIAMANKTVICWQNTKKEIFILTYNL